MTIRCPICSAPLGGEEPVCGKCGAAVSDYISASCAPDLLFNEAAALAAAGEARAAYDKLAAAHYLRPHDIEILLSMARLAESLGDTRGAMEKLALVVVNHEDAAHRREYNRLAALFSEEQALAREKRKLTGLLYSDVKELVAKAVSDAFAAVSAKEDAPAPPRP